MEQRFVAMQEIKDRFYEKKNDLGLLYLKDTPSGEIDPDQTPAILLTSGTDSIGKYSNRSDHGYPAQRILEVSIEAIINSRDIDVVDFFKNVRKTAFIGRGTNPEIVDIQVADGVFIRENRSEGPFGYGLPNMIGMRLVLDLLYTDNGII